MGLLADVQSGPTFSGETLRDGGVVCTNYGTMFDVEVGECIFDPCVGVFLSEILVTVVPDGVYLADEECEFVGPGPIETDPMDLFSASNIDF